MAACDISAERLREVLHYEPATGAFTWRKRLSCRAVAGSRAGSDANGYIVIRVDRRLYKAHRLAWLYVTGEWPSDMIDHANGDRGDNRFCNLRESSPVHNLQNLRQARSDSGSGVLGVSWDAPRRKWKAQIKPPGEKNCFIGRFDTIDEAQQAYLAAKRRLHQGCTI